MGERMVFLFIIFGLVTRKMSRIRLLRVANVILSVGSFWWVIGSYGSMMSGKCYVSREFIKRKFIVYIVWIRMRGKGGGKISYEV